MDILISGGITVVRSKKKVKTIIVILGVLAFGFIGFQVLKRQSPDIERTHQIIKTVQLEDRKITKSPFVPEYS